MSAARRSVSRASTERFSDRVADYVRYRPGYPSELMGLLVHEAGLVPGNPVADIGAGTGILSRLLLACGMRVRAVEPNAAMRAAADTALAGLSGFASVEGTAEATALATASVRLVTAAQAFHWFDMAAARTEFQRILRPGGHVALIWNVRRLDDVFGQCYEALLKAHCPEYAQVGLQIQADEALIAEFYAPGRYRRHDLDYQQQFDRDGLRGRLSSSSYAPAEGAPGYRSMMQALDDLFEGCQQGGKVTVNYDTRVFIGTLEPN